MNYIFFGINYFLLGVFIIILTSKELNDLTDMIYKHEIWGDDIDKPDFENMESSKNIIKKVLVYPLLLLFLPFCVVYIHISFLLKFISLKEILMDYENILIYLSLFSPIYFSLYILSTVNK